MKKLVTISAFLVIFGLVITQSALAGRVGNRQVHQNQRIARGTADCELTRGETRQLLRQQHHIRKQKQLAWSDGVLTGKEKARLMKFQDRADRDIFRLKHNNRRGNCWRSAEKS